MIGGYVVSRTSPRYVVAVCVLGAIVGVFIGYVFMEGVVTTSGDNLPQRAPRLYFTSGDPIDASPGHSLGQTSELANTNITKLKLRLLPNEDKAVSDVYNLDQELSASETDEWTEDGVEVDFPNTDTEFSELKFEEDENGRRKHLPDCILIGERKTGTTALLHFLKQHPQIKAADREVHYFDRSRNYKHGINWYRKQMKPAKDSEITFEKSPRYFRTPWSPKRISGMNPNIKLLLLVTDPIKRAVSDFHFCMSSDWKGGFDNHEYKTFDEYILRGTDKVDATFAPIVRSLYDVSMENWLNYFNLSNFHILDGDSFVQHNPSKELQKIEKFLGIKPYFTNHMFFYSKSKGFYCLTDPGCLHFGGKPHPAVTEPVGKRLRKFFEPHNQKFYDLVGRDFHWET